MWRGNLPFQFPDVWITSVVLFKIVNICQNTNSFKSVAIFSVMRYYCFMLCWFMCSVNVALLNWILPCLRSVQRSVSRCAGQWESLPGCIDSWVHNLVLQCQVKESWNILRPYVWCICSKCVNVQILIFPFSGKNLVFVNIKMTTERL